MDYIVRMIAKDAPKMCIRDSHTAVPGGHRVKPTHPAGPSCGSAELPLVSSPAAKFCPGFSQKLTHERLCLRTDTGGVGLGDTDDIVNRGGWNRGAHTAKPG